MVVAKLVPILVTETKPLLPDRRQLDRFVNPIHLAPRYRPPKTRLEISVCLRPRIHDSPLDIRLQRLGRLKLRRGPIIPLALGPIRIWDAVNRKRDSLVAVKGDE